jgi:hypothetical protein
MENDNKLNSVSKDLYDIISTKFPDLQLGDESANVVTSPEYARFFDFTYTHAGNTLGKISISIDDKALTVIYSKNIMTGQGDLSRDAWYNFLRKIRKIAIINRLTFDVRDINKSNLTKRDYQVISNEKFKGTAMSESKFYGTSQRSYLNIGEARLVIKHSQPINHESPSGRTQHVDSIYIESSTGERYKYPFKHLNGAKAMARHVSSGGNQYDDFGSHIISLSEELAKLGKFKRYMNRGGVMAESLTDYVGAVNERVEELKQRVSKLQRETFYTEAIESFESSDLIEVPEDIAENWIDQLTIKQFNEELKDVFPYIYRIVSEKTRADVIGPDALEQELEEDPCWKNYKQIGMKKKGGREVPNCVPKEELEIEAAFESLMGQFADTPVEEGIKDKLKVLALIGMAGMGGNMALDSISAKNSPLGQALAVAAQAGDREAAYYLKNLDAYIDGHDTRTLAGLRHKYMGQEQYEETDESETDECPGNDNPPPPPQTQKTPIGDFILSFYDRNSGQFPKGETAVLTMVEKEYGDHYVPMATEFINKVHGLYEKHAGRTDPYIDKLKHLAGI